MLPMANSALLYHANTRRLLAPSHFVVTDPRPWHRRHR